MGKTAAEFMAELAKDKKYQKAQREEEKKLKKLEKLYDKDEKELVKELHKAGFKVKSVYDFINVGSKYEFLNAENQYFEYSAALPILIKHLKTKHHPKIVTGIARALADKQFIHSQELWDTLLELYKHTPSDKQIDIPEERGAQESIAVALRTLATEERLGDLKDIVDKMPNADARDWLEELLGEGDLDKKKRFRESNGSNKKKPISEPVLEK